MKKREKERNRRRKIIKHNKKKKNMEKLNIIENNLKNEKQTKIQRKNKDK